MKISVALERVAIGVASLVLSVALIALLSGYFAGHDPAGISGTQQPVGADFRDQGDAHLAPGTSDPRYDSNPPTSGPHVPVPVTHDETQLSNDQLLQALELGNVVVMYGERRPPASLVALADEIAAPFTAALAASGQAVILARRPGTVGLIALAWAHGVAVSAANDPLLKQFIQYWLGRGAPRRLPGG